MCLKLLYIKITANKGVEWDKSIQEMGCEVTVQQNGSRSLSNRVNWA